MALDDQSPVSPRRLPPGTRIAAVVSEYHQDLTGGMLRSAQAELEGAGLEEGSLEVAWVPGAFELPIVAQAFAGRQDVDAVLCFGLVLTGETTHDRWVCHAATEGILRVSLETQTPVLFGLLTCQSMEQARERALPSSEGGHHDKGREVARAAVGVLAALEIARGQGKGARQ